MTYVDDSEITVFDDGNGRRQVDPTADSRGQEYTINEQTMTATLVVNADLGDYSPAVGAAQLLPNGNLVYTSGDQGTNPNAFGQTIQVLPDGTQTFVQQKSGLEYRSYMMANLYGTPANVLNLGFEYPIEGAGNWQYGPTGSAWSFSIGAGVSGNDSGFTSGNQNAPQASQVGFLQGNKATISQPVDFAAAGTYVISVSAAQRANFHTSDQIVDVDVDGTVVYTFTPASTIYTTYTTPSFTVTAGSHTISFVSVDPKGTDYTAFLDQVSVTNAPPTGFADSGFENPSVGAGKFLGVPMGTAWTFSTGAGVSGNGSGFTSGNPNAPEGSQVGYIQTTGTISQVVNAAEAGAYQISFSAAQRANNGTSDEEVQVLVDGTVVGTITPASTSYANYTTASFNLTAGSHTITFAGVDPTLADFTALLDQVSLDNVPATGLSDPGFENPSQGTGKFQYDPTGSAWSFTGGAGLAGNGSGFTSGNPNAPQGGQVAFLQTKGGAISQAVNFPTAGSYVISLSAAQRANFGTSDEEVQVEVDGAVVDTITPASTNYTTYTTPSFYVTAGNHTITFVGLNPTTGDHTALLDQVSIYSAPTQIGFSDPGFEIPSVGMGNFKLDPTGSAWSFTGGAGLAGNGSGYTIGNPNAPQGSQVAFLQGQGGSISQAVNFAAAGSYEIGVSAAQRANFGTSDEQVEVLVDGTVVDTFTPASIDYTTYTTASFNVTAGSHTISFVGIDPSGVDYTALLDDAGILLVG